MNAPVELICRRWWGCPDCRAVFYHGTEHRCGEKEALPRDADSEVTE